MSHNTEKFRFSENAGRLDLAVQIRTVARPVPTLIQTVRPLISTARPNNFNVRVCVFNLMRPLVDNYAFYALETRFFDAVKNNDLELLECPFNTEDGEWRYSAAMAEFPRHKLVLDFIRSTRFLLGNVTAGHYLLLEDDVVPFRRKFWIEVQEVCNAISNGEIALLFGPEAGALALLGDATAFSRLLDYLAPRAGKVAVASDIQPLDLALMEYLESSGLCVKRHIVFGHIGHHSTLTNNSLRPALWLPLFIQRRSTDERKWVTAIRKPARKFFVRVFGWFIRRFTSLSTIFDRGSN